LRPSSAADQLADPLGIRQACQAVVSRANDVQIGSLEVALRAIENLPVPDWDRSWHYQGPPGRMLEYVLVLDTINFCFWGSAAAGYAQLAIRLRKVFEASDELMVANLRACDARRLGELVGELPMLEERAEALRELGDRGLPDLIGDSAVATARQLSSCLGSYADVAFYQGLRVPFLKRAQIVAADLCLAGVRQFADLDQLTCFADYKLPQMLRHWGALIYSNRLAQAVDAMQPLAPGSSQEIEIRAATVVAVDRLRDQMAGRGRQLSSAQVDWIIWQSSQSAESVRPYHRTRTIFY
jgi:Potential Queuosine, Q, salvage protein family